jgi:large subunit ribosomal protein L25
MTEKIVLNASVRELSGSANARRYRKSGLVPAVLYNEKAESQSLLIPVLEAKKNAEHHGIVTVNIDGQEKLAIIKDVQYNYITNIILHMDLLEVDVNHVVTASVPVEPTGTPAGEMNGGELAQTLHEIDIECLPNVLPEVLLVDVSALKIGDTLLVKEMTLPEGIVAVTNEDSAIFQLNAPKAAAATQSDEEEAAE